MNLLTSLWLRARACLSVRCDIYLRIYDVSARLLRDEFCYLRIYDVSARLLRDEFCNLLLHRHRARVRSVKPAHFPILTDEKFAKVPTDASRIRLALQVLEHVRRRAPVNAHFRHHDARKTTFTRKRARLSRAKGFLEQEGVTRKCHNEQIVAKLVLERLQVGIVDRGQATEARHVDDEHDFTFGLRKVIRITVRIERRWEVVECVDVGDVGTRSVGTHDAARQ